MNSAVTFNDAALGYAQPILQHVSLSFGAGVHAIVGPSGAGKSTLLRAAVGLLLPLRGAVHVGGTSVSAAMSTVAMSSLRAQVGYMVQEGGLFPHMSLRDNLLLAWRARRDSGGAVSRIAELAAQTSLSVDLLERFPDEVSGGQRQRVAMMRALLFAPAVLLLDEPFSALDPIVRLELARELRRLANRDTGRVLLWVTHDIDEARINADTITVVRDGTAHGPAAVEVAMRQDPYLMRYEELSRRT
jgi:osmoprotectant transport system ATP-binding protein